MLRSHSLVAGENSIAGVLVEQIQARYVLRVGRKFCFYTLDDVLAALETLKERDPSVLLVPDVSAVLFFFFSPLLPYNFACLLAC